MAVRDAQAYAAAIKKRLDAIPAQVRQEIAAAQNQNAQEMVALAKSLAPKKTGALQASIRSEAGKTDLSVKVVAGDADAYYARFVEFGTRGSSEGDEQGFVEKLTLTRGAEEQKRRRKARRTHPGTRAQPFFFPAYRALKKRMKSRASRAASKGIKAAVGSST